MNKIRIFISIWLLALFHTSCSSISAKYSPKIAKEKKNAIILIHGYYGSNLNRKSNNSRVWLNTWSTIWSSSTVALDEGKNIERLEISGAEELVVDGMMAAVPIVPPFYTADVYRSTLKYLENSFGENSEIIPFSYDWRKDNLLAVQSLDSLIQNLKRAGKQKIILIAHSMGGLIATYYLRYGIQPFDTAEENWSGAKNIDALVIAGTPFQGSTAIFRNMQWGVKIGLNKSLLKAEAIGSFPASYQLLPDLEKVILNKNFEPFLQGKNIGEAWITKKWGLLQFSGIDPISFHNRERFTRIQYEKAKLFQKLINSPKNSKRDGSLKIKTKLLTIIGKGRKTLEKGIWLENTEKNIHEFLFTEDGIKKHFPGVNSDFLFSDGDESVSAESAQTPLAYQTITSHYESITSTNAHSELYKDENVKAGIKRFLE